VRTGEGRPTELLSHCVNCRQETRHDVCGQVPREETQESGYSWTEDSYLLQCRGCGSTSLRKVFSDIADNFQVEVFPTPVTRQRPDWLERVSGRVQDLLEEIYVSLDAGSCALPVMGARTIFDILIQDAVGDQGNFGRGLAALEDAGFLSKEDRKVLEAAIEAGHASAHRGHRPERRDVDCVISIMEHMVRMRYVLREDATTLEKNTPRRPPRK